MSTPASSTPREVRLLPVFIDGVPVPSDGKAHLAHVIAGSHSNTRGGPSFPLALLTLLPPPSLLAVRSAEEACTVLLSIQFEPCHDEVNPAPFLRNCRFDVCSCTDGQECLCAAVASYAAACARKGVLVNWRSPKFCGNGSLGNKALGQKRPQCWGGC